VNATTSIPFDVCHEDDVLELFQCFFLANYIFAICFLCCVHVCFLIEGQFFCTELECFIICICSGIVRGSLLGSLLLLDDYFLEKRKYG